MNAHTATATYNVAEHSERWMISPSVFYTCPGLANPSRHRLLSRSATVTRSYSRVNENGFRFLQVLIVTFGIRNLQQISEMKHNLSPRRD